MDSYDYAGGFPGLNHVRVNGSDFVESYQVMQQVVAYVRAERLPCLMQAKVPLLGDIPVLGHLFKTTGRVSNKTELLIFLTPKIVNEKIVIK